MPPAGLEERNAEGMVLAHWAALRPDRTAIVAPSGDRTFAELQAGVAPSDALAAELIAFCRDRLAHFKCPRSIDFIDELPRHDNGKIYKRLLRDRYRA